MTKAQEVHRAYMNLYKEMRRYIWDFDVVEELADLEIACFKAIPESEDIKKSIGKMRKLMVDVLQDDEDLRDTVDKLYDLADEAEYCYVLQTPSLSII